MTSVDDDAAPPSTDWTASKILDLFQSMSEVKSRQDTEDQQKIDTTTYQLREAPACTIEAWRKHVTLFMAVKMIQDKLRDTYVLILQKMPPKECDVPTTPCENLYCPNPSRLTLAGTYRVSLEPRKNLSFRIVPTKLVEDRPKDFLVESNVTWYCLTCLEDMWNQGSVLDADTYLASTALCSGSNPSEPIPQIDSKGSLDKEFHSIKSVLVKATDPPRPNGDDNLGANTSVVTNGVERPMKLRLKPPKLPAMAEGQSRVQAAVKMRTRDALAKSRDSKAKLNLDGADDCLRTVITERLESDPKGARNYTAGYFSETVIDPTLLELSPPLLIQSPHKCSNYPMPRVITPPLTPHTCTPWTPRRVDVLEAANRAVQSPTSKSYATRIGVSCSSRLNSKAKIDLSSQEKERPNDDLQLASNQSEATRAHLSVSVEHGPGDSILPQKEDETRHVNGRIPTQHKRDDFYSIHPSSKKLRMLLFRRKASQPSNQSSRKRLSSMSIVNLDHTQIIGFRSPPPVYHPAEKVFEVEPIELWCYCRGPDDGSTMIACSNEDECVREWFHFRCTGLTQLPEDDEAWYCNDCQYPTNTDGAIEKRKPRKRPTQRRNARLKLSAPRKAATDTTAPPAPLFPNLEPGILPSLPASPTSPPLPPLTPFQNLYSSIRPETRYDRSGYITLSAPQINALGKWKAAMQYRSLFQDTGNAAFLAANGLLSAYPVDDPDACIDELYAASATSHPASADHAACCPSDDDNGGGVAGVMEIGGLRVELNYGDVCARELSGAMQVVDERVQVELDSMGWTPGPVEHKGPRIRLRMKPVVVQGTGDARVSDDDDETSGSEEDDGVYLSEMRKYW
ncbi:MAG: hypothetical protein M1833_005511 [Piccolia ochrophora]|nr:MAG: hypothetical protein M1833_005511 [Piccolia ochrophora]